MKARWLLMLVIFCMKLGMVCYADETEPDGVWTYVSASIPYELEGMQNPPERAVLALKDDVTGLEYEREVPLKKITEKEQNCVEGFSCPLTVSGYDADVFLLGDVEISANEDLSFYGVEILKAAGLSPDYYRIESVEWIGVIYEVDEILYRDAVAKGEKLIRNVEVLYGGQVRVPEVNQSVEPEAEKEEMKEENISENRNPTRSEILEEAVVEPPVVRESEAGIFEKAMQWMREHLTIVTISIGSLLILTGVLLSGLYQKKKSRD